MALNVNLVSSLRIVTMYLERFSYDLEMKTRKQNKKTNERK